MKVSRTAHLRSLWFLPEAGVDMSIGLQRLARVQATKTGRQEHGQAGGTHGSVYSYLIAVHFVLPDDLDGHLVILAGGILGAVDVAEGAVAHLVQQDPAFKTRIPGHFNPALLLLLDDLFDVMIARALGRGFRGPLLGLGLAISAPGVDGVQVAGGGRILPGGLSLVLGVHGRHVGGGLGVGSDHTRLFAMTYEILEALDGTHDAE